MMKMKSFMNGPRFIRSKIYSFLKVFNQIYLFQRNFPNPVQSRSNVEGEINSVTNSNGRA